VHVPTFARLPVRDGLGRVSVVALLAVMTVSPRREVAALKTHAPTHASRQFVQLHVEATAPGVQVAVAYWNHTIRMRDSNCN
jgi:hypothetical protein